MTNTICIENHRIRSKAEAGNNDVVIDYIDADDADQSSDGLISLESEGDTTVKKVDKLTVDQQASGLTGHFKWVKNDHFTEGLVVLP